MLGAWLANLITTQNIKTMLDIWAGKGNISLLAASYGVKVDAVDPQLMRGWQFPRYLIDHPLIDFYQLKIEEFGWEKGYDLIVCSNVVMFLQREYVFWVLLAQVYRHLSDHGYFLLAFLDAEDPSIPTQHRYYLSDFERLSGRKMIAKHSHTIHESHPPLGKHQHLVHTLLLQKLLIP